MNIITNIVTKNPCYTTNQKITVKGLMLHSVGCSQPNAKVFINAWNNVNYGAACVHGIIDGNSGDIYQLLPWNHRGWHCGSGNKGSANNTHIGVEMCEPAEIHYTNGSNFTCSNKTAAKATVKRTYDSAVQLFAYLCKQYNLNPMADGVIISHKEGNSRGIASNHGDPEHLWDQLNTGYTMNGFRKDVQAAMIGTTTTTTNSTANSNNSQTESTNSSYPSPPFVITAKLPDLNIRSSYSLDSSIKGQTGKGSFTITEVKNDFGKLKSGAGWVYLKNSNYVTIGKTLTNTTTTTTQNKPYTVKVTTNALNIRSGAGTNYSIVGCIRDMGVYTITETKNNFGKLKSGAGWICLDYTKKI